LIIINKIGKHYELPVLTDIHTHEEAFQAAHYVDVLQIPAFIMQANGITALQQQIQVSCINIKKGQFLSASAMKFAVERSDMPGITMCGLLNGVQPSAMVIWWLTTEEYPQCKVLMSLWCWMLPTAFSSLTKLRV
jgi:hypothetical protein